MGNVLSPLLVQKADCFGEPFALEGVDRYDERKSALFQCTFNLHAKSVRRPV